MEVRIEGLTKAYDGLSVVDNLQLVADEGKLTTLLGPSGCGKTTTLRCVAGLEQPTQGRITIGTNVVADTKKGISVPVQNRDVGFVFQSFDVWPHMTVFENVAYPLRVRDYSNSEIESKVSEILDLADILPLKENAATTLSGGQQARVGLCRALVYEPKVLLCDEPLSGLDRNLRKTLYNELKAIQSELDTTTIYVTHDQSEAMAISDKIALMNTNGKIEQRGDAESIYQNPRSKFGFEFVGDSQILTGEVVDDGVVNTPIGYIHCMIRSSPGSIVNIGFRPANVIIDSSDRQPRTKNTWVGEIVHSYYFGNEYEVDVNVGDEIIKARVNPKQYHNLKDKDGQQVTVGVSRSDVYTFTEGGRSTQIRGESPQLQS
ncbi:ABC transporter ATP-binding protein [Natrialbaceae archaeon A-CW1-1]